MSSHTYAAPIGRRFPIGFFETEPYQFSFGRYAIFKESHVTSKSFDEKNRTMRHQLKQRCDRDYGFFVPKFLNTWRPLYTKLKKGQALTLNILL